MKTLQLITLFSLLLTGCSPCSDCGDLTPEQLTPPDFKSIENVKEKKAAFFEYLYPLTIEANKRVWEEKMAFADLSTQSEPLNSDQITNIAETAKTYKINCDSPNQECASNIHKKIGMIPPSLILAQAANESAWGTSRFAQDGNNYFGQWCYSKGCGLKPSQRDTGASHEVREFDNAFLSVKSYIHNLNTSASYKQLRQTRREAWNNNKKPNGVKLATGLTKYSERGAEYVSEIQHMIQYNKLLELDKKFWKEIETYQSLKK